MSTPQKNKQSSNKLDYFMRIVNDKEQWRNVAELYYEYFIVEAVAWMRGCSESEKTCSNGKEAFAILNIFKLRKEIYKYRQPKSLNAYGSKPKDVKENTAILFEGIINSLLTKASSTWDYEDKKKLSLLREIFPLQVEDVRKIKDIRQVNDKPVGYKGLEKHLTRKEYANLDRLLTKLESAVDENTLKKEEKNERSKSQEATISTAEPAVIDSKKLLIIKRELNNKEVQPAQDNPKTVTFNDLKKELRNNEGYSDRFKTMLENTEFEEEDIDKPLNKLGHKPLHFALLYKSDKQIWSLLMKGDSLENKLRNIDEKFRNEIFYKKYTPSKQAWLWRCADDARNYRQDPAYKADQKLPPLPANNPNKRLSSPKSLVAASTTKPTTKNIREKTISTKKTTISQNKQVKPTQPSAEKWGIWGERYNATTLASVLKKGKDISDQVETLKQEIPVAHPTSLPTSVFPSTGNPRLNSNVFSELSGSSAPADSGGYSWGLVGGAVAVGVTLVGIVGGFFSKRALDNQRTFKERGYAKENIEKGCEEAEGLNRLSSR